MQIHYPQIVFERYADDTICHCRTKEESEKMRVIIMNRLSECKLKLNEDKTRIVYCKDSNREENHENITFDFLGYTYRPREAQNRKTGKIFTNFLPGISQKSKNHIQETIRSWKLKNKKKLIELDTEMEAPVRSWINYYGKFYESSLKSTLQALNYSIVRWANRKYKRFKGSFKQVWQWLIRCYQNNPKLFYHWYRGIIPSYYKLKPVMIRRAE
jgi:RNA-directed DNA polymerase